MRMTRTPDTEKIAAEQKVAAALRAAEENAAEVPERRARAVAADRLGLSGPEGSRRRGSLLRRLLALGDWTALIAALLVVTATTSSTDVADLFWAILFSPSWILSVRIARLLGPGLSAETISAGFHSGGPRPS